MTGEPKKRRSYSEGRDPSVALGRRIATLRKQRGWTQKSVCDAVRERGLSWSRVSLQKIEEGKRAGVSVQELLVIAAVFDVPPALLLADPRVEDEVPVGGPGDRARAWDALLWVTGDLRLDGSPADSGPYRDAGLLIAAGRRVAEAWAVLNPAEPPLERTIRQDEAAKDALMSLAMGLRALVRWGAPVPGFVDVKRAAKLARSLRVPEIGAALAEVEQPTSGQGGD